MGVFIPRLQNTLNRYIQHYYISTSNRRLGVNCVHPGMLCNPLIFLLFLRSPTLHRRFVEVQLLNIATFNSLENYYIACITRKQFSLRSAYPTTPSCLYRFERDNLGSSLTLSKPALRSRKDEDSVVVVVRGIVQVCAVCAPRPQVSRPRNLPVESLSPLTASSALLCHPS
jgi:hypothetical protein